MIYECDVQTIMMTKEVLQQVFVVDLVGLVMMMMMMKTCAFVSLWKKIGICSLKFVEMMAVAVRVGKMDFIFFTIQIISMI